MYIVTYRTFLGANCLPETGFRAPTPPKKQNFSGPKVSPQKIDFSDQCSPKNRF